MSIYSTRKTEISGRRSTRKAPSTPSSTNYDIYCVNFYDSGLKAVRDEYITQIKLGLRRFLFVIDLDTELKEAQQAAKKLKNSDVLPPTAVNLALLSIKNCLAEYDFVSRKIEAELAFNMLKYYQRYMPAPLKMRNIDPKKDKSSGMESKRNVGKSTTDTKAMTKISCFNVVAKEHHKVGKGNALSKRLYIKDAPSNTKILIVIIGQLDNKFYTDLLAHEVPLKGVVHFLPEQSAYDLLVPRPRRERELRESIEKIQVDIHSLRKRTLSKPVGVLQQQLPQMSVCQAVRYASNIFDQLTWFLYDVQTLREQYAEYYVKPYHEINVKMSPGASMQSSFQMADSLSIQGHYLKSEVPAVHDDDATIYLYLESLLCTFGNPRELMTELEVLLLANPTSIVSTKVLDKIKVYASAFKSIIKLVKCERLFVEEANTLLLQLVSYMDQKLMQNIYHACLEYNVLRRYFSSGYIRESLYYTPYSNDLEPRHLPKYAKLYLTDDSVNQRIIQLIDQYKHHKIEEIHPNIKLYTFRRALNEIFEERKQLVIPTRLCFRDFTLYEMDRFLKDLITPQMFDDSIESKTSHIREYGSTYTLRFSDDDDKDGNAFTDTSQPYPCRQNRNYFVQPSVFIRPKSLQAKMLNDAKTEKEKQKKERVTQLRLRESARSTMKTVHGSRFEGSSERPTFIGLGVDHPMLHGYNLDDARQTIDVKTSKYHFEEGQITLYEEKWNFRQINKCLSIEIDKQTLHLINPRNNAEIVSPNIRFQTPKGICLRLLPQGDECTKAVLNYPNGLTLYCHDTHAEHVWSGQQSELNESRRICTPYGCVIVFYTNSSMVLIMRYNGEVYRLYSVVVVSEENEAEMEDDTEFLNACSTQSTYSSYKPLRERPLKKGVPSTESATNRTVAGADAMSRKTVRLETSSISSHTLATRAVKVEARQVQLAQSAALLDSIDPEIKFLERMMQLYNLTYKHLKLTTSLGSVVHVEAQKINCDKPIRVTEWHDYFANESYAMRDDGVCMVWTKDALKCYHSDGTMICTTSVDGHDKGIVEDDVDQQISSSSSHLKPASSPSTNVSTIVVNSPYGEIFCEKIGEDQRVEEIGMMEMEAEDVYKYDYSFATYIPDSFLMEHRSYAGTKFHLVDSDPENLKVKTSVFASDNLQFRIYAFSRGEWLNRVSSNGENSSDNQTAESLSNPRSSEADSDEWTNFTQPKWVYNELDETTIDIDASNLKISMQSTGIQLFAQLKKFGCDENAIAPRENILLNVDFRESLATVFHDWVKTFYRFINCACPKWRSTYFVEAIMKDCRKKGLELMKNVPALGKYNFCAGNYFIDPRELESVSASMTRKLDHEKDLLKFPRFADERKVPKIVDFPTVLSTSIYVEIPAQLAYTDRIHLFLNPFDKIKFRKLKHRFSEAVLFHLHPHLRQKVHKEISHRSWLNYHSQNKRRKFHEQQRLSLYAAMLKHKVYPNYFQFRDLYHSHVRNIDFFEFMASKCNEKANPEHYKDPKPNLPAAPLASVTGEQKKRKKCLCPKYIKSLQ